MFYLQLHRFPKKTILDLSALEKIIYRKFDISKRDQLSDDGVNSLANLIVSV